MKRRDFLKLAGAASVAGCAHHATPSKARVVVVGGGFGGATAAKYIRMWDPSIDVVLVERESPFVSCPISNLVLGGYSSMADISRGYDGLRQYGVQVVRDEVDGDRRGEENGAPRARRRPRLRAADRLAGHRFQLQRGAGLRSGDAGGQRAACLESRARRPWRCASSSSRCAMAASTSCPIPMAPYRCPPGPYERASMVAAYFKEAKPRSKVLVLDANPDVTSKAGLFKRAWSDLYPGIIEYRGNSRAVAVDGERAHREARARRREGRRAERRAAAPRRPTSRRRRA